jgi:predicted O-methyltransferase YrrM
MSPELFHYIEDKNPEIHPALQALRERTSKMPYSQMQISHEQGAFMRFMAGAIGARHVLEIGCFTGYSAICVASALPAEGKLITLDIDPENTKVAREFFTKTGLDDRIELKIGDAHKTLDDLLENEGASYFDMAFIDADKTGMPSYLEKCLDLVRVGGIIVCDNVIWSGTVVDPHDQSKDTVAIRRFNELVERDHRFERCFVNIADGLSLLRRL